MKHVLSVSGVFVCIAGFLVLFFGWILGVQSFTSVLPGFVTMKASTSLGFILTGTLLFFMNHHEAEMREWRGIVLPIAATGLLLLMAALLTSSVFDLQIGLYDQGRMSALGLGQPSLGTIACFVLVGITGLLRLLPGTTSTHVQLCGGAIAILSSISIVGYVIDEPMLYYLIDGISNGMAIHTTALFFLVGTSLLVFATDDPNM